ncbi:MAG: right-handed parallel beta-helix repeat-containing protein [Longimicrobiales bacterium]|nr:right-handed parallel beta-helix repeat-containing protein [Longimicrobiales bacterium]
MICMMDLRIFKVLNWCVLATPRSFSVAFVAIAAAGTTSLLASVALADGPAVTLLSQAAFEDGTYEISEPGVYRLAEDISFNPHPVGSLGEDGVTKLDAYDAGLPFRSQLGMGEGQYDPAAYGIGFFAAIAIFADDVTLDLNGHTIEQHAEHALLQRFFAVIETSDRPFVPGQGPHGFGATIQSATNLTIKNGTIGRSSHHGIHGNGNRNVKIKNVDFVDFEVAAVALNGVEGLKVIETTARNREDVPVIGTYSNARFIAAYLDWLVMTSSATTLRVQGVELSASQVQSALRASVNAVFEDVIEDGAGFIDPVEHPDAYALYHNWHGIIDGNSYGFLVNPLGVAVNGFPNRAKANPSRDIVFRDVSISSQRAFINEVVAVRQGAGPAIDPIGAVFMLKNTHPDTGAPITVTSLEDGTATYRGNALANAQALVAKAAHNEEFPPFLNVSRLNITPEIVSWIESQGVLSDLVPTPSDYLCNGDTMFHVNKGVIGFKIDGAVGVRMRDTEAENLENLGLQGTSLCGDYAKSNPHATLEGYGGATVRAYTFAGSSDVRLKDVSASNLWSLAGSVSGCEVLTDSDRIRVRDCDVYDVEAGLSFVDGEVGPNEEPTATGVRIGADAGSKIRTRNIRLDGAEAFGDVTTIRDDRP